MTNILKFSAVTEENYTPAEIEELEEAFVAFINDVDPGVVEGTEDISVVPNTKALEIPEKVRKQVIAEFLANTKVEIGLQLRMADANGEGIPDSVRGLSGFAEAPQRP